MADIQEVKARVNTAEFAEKRWGVQFKKDGQGRMKACCPLHQEAEPSFVVYPDGGWTCFGGCNRSGDVIDLVQLKDGVEFNVALAEVARYAGVTLTPMTPEVRARVAARRLMEAALAVAVEHWHKRLQATAKAMAYCRSRGWDEETVGEHRLGYADGSVRGALERAGVDLRSREAKAAMAMPKGMLVYPHRVMGRVVYVSGRLADLERKGHYNPPSQLIGSRRPFWNAVQGSDVGVVVEGQADAVSLGQWGVAAVALAGCGLTLTAGQELTRRLGHIRQVYIWPDADGRTDVAGLAEALGPMVKVVEPPKGVADINDWLQKGGTAELAGKVLGQAETWMELLIGQAARSRGDEDAMKAVMRAFNALDVWGQAAWRKRICRSLDLTVDEMRAMVKAVGDEDESGVVMTDEYCVRQGMFCRVVHGESGVQYRALGNFTAEILQDVLEDDGEEALRRFVLRGKLAAGAALPQVEVEAAEFGRMQWLTEQWGARATVAAGSGTRDHLRASIQLLSEKVETRHEFSHLGWRVMNGVRFYLSSAGAVGREGVQVRSISDLARYQLPMTPMDAVAAVEASLAFLETGDYAVTLPLWAAMYLAPLASIVPPPFTLWLYGTTGSLKSTATALAMCHYGKFAYNTPPASWTGTTNALEKKAFLVKDAPLWIDDYTAQSTMKGMQEIRRKADQLLRDWGNRTGRSRMQSNLRLRRTFAPRGLIISTAEQLPPGRSILARLFAVEVHPGMMTKGAGSQLTAAQLEGSRLYSHAMGGYLLWLAEHWQRLENVLHERQMEYTEAARDEGEEHLRMPGNVATMFLGLEVGLEYAQAMGAIDKVKADGLREAGWWVLLGIGEQQYQVVAEENPIEMYLEALGQRMAQGTIYLRRREDPDNGERIRPRHKTLTADFLGWYDDEFWYLLPKATYSAVVAFYRASGTMFPDSERGVRTKLREQGLTISQDNRLTWQLRVGEERHRVLRIGLTKKFELMQMSGDNGNNDDIGGKKEQLEF